MTIHIFIIAAMLNCFQKSSKSMHCNQNKYLLCYRSVWIPKLNQNLKETQSPLMSLSCFYVVTLYILKVGETVGLKSVLSKGQLLATYRTKSWKISTCYSWIEGGSLQCEFGMGLELMSLKLQLKASISLPPQPNDKSIRSLKRSLVKCQQLKIPGVFLLFKYHNQMCLFIKALLTGQYLLIIIMGPILQS